MTIYRRKGVKHLSDLFITLIKKNNHIPSELITKLREFEENSYVPKIKGGTISGNKVEADSILSEIILLADDVLLDENGQCNWKNIDVVQNAGFKVSSWETDSRGWLTGSIETTKGIIVYG